MAELLLYYSTTFGNYFRLVFGNGNTRGQSLYWMIIVLVLKT